MKTDLLAKHLSAYKTKLAKRIKQQREERAERAERAAYYQSWTKDRIRAMSVEEFYEYIAKLWAMLIWGNKKYVVDKLIAENGFQQLKDALADMVWSTKSLEERWNNFRSKVKGMGPAMMSEILCHTHPDQCALWNRRAYVGLNYLGVDGLPRYDYQITGKKYVELSKVLAQIAEAMRKIGMGDADLLAADYFMWDQLQVQSNLSQIHKPPKLTKASTTKETSPKLDTATFVHNDVRDKLAEIGEWLGFKTRVEVTVADGSKVDTVWESTIGNMGRVIYVFEVQTKGSIDSLIINLLKALNNPAVQGIVAVSDLSQVETIKKHAAPVKQLADKLRTWNYAEVLDVHEKLQTVNEAINGLKLVPEGF